MRRNKVEEENRSKRQATTIFTLIKTNAALMQADGDSECEISENYRAKRMHDISARSS